MICCKVPRGMLPTISVRSMSVPAKAVAILVDGELDDFAAGAVARGSAYVVDDHVVIEELDVHAIEVEVVDVGDAAGERVVRRAASEAGKQKSQPKRFHFSFATFS
jgi:hypothetical protein